MMMHNAFDVHVAANNARDIRGAYMARSLRNVHMPRSLSALALVALALIARVKAALGSLAMSAPLAGHRS